MRTQIRLNPEKLSNVVKSNLVEFFGKNLTPDLIDTLTKQISTTVNDYVMKFEEGCEVQ